ncbi:MAG: sugar O-acetyltransferase [Methanomicrobiales archaeon]|nr:sugar O-acetyltransferase [Methanomicrobiales archaeon]
MTEKERMLRGELYAAQDEELKQDRLKARRLTRLFNETTEEEPEYRTELLTELFQSTGEHISIEPLFRCDYGSHIRIGDDFYANYDCIIIDVCEVTIGDHVFLGPRVGIYTAAHPIDAEVRDANLEYGEPITIGNSVWIGANTVINPGVTVGNNVVIGSGSVVTNNIPNDVIAVGNPCRVLRAITPEDKEYWEEKRREYMED